MKQKILIFLFLFAPILVFAQNELETELIYVDFDKTKHLVMPDQVLDITLGRDDYITAERVEEAPMIIRLTTQEESFADTTNLTVVCNNGEVYSYRICYLPENYPDSYVIYATDKTQSYYRDVVVNNRNTTQLLLPEQIIYCRHGNEEVLGVEYFSNVLKLGTTFGSIPQTNIFIVDRSFQVYEITVNSGVASSYVYNIESDRKYPVLLDVNSLEMRRMIEKVKLEKRNIFSVGVIKNRFEISLANLFVYDDFLFLSFDFKNYSNINYDIDFFKCFIRDQKTSKRMLYQEIEVAPVFQSLRVEKVLGKGENRLILVFNKFTIPDDKVFEVEMYEKNGERNMKILILNDYLLSAQLLK